MARLPIRRGEAREAGREVAAWDPWRELEEMHERIGRLLEEGLGELTAAGGWAPAVDVEETDDAWLVEAELPGVKRDDITVEVRDNELAIYGDIHERERKGILRRRARRTGRFDYRLALPGEIDAEAVVAGLEEGVLTVRIPKAAGSRGRRIEIGGG